jgi:hypothetical protein
MMYLISHTRQVKSTAEKNVHIHRLRSFQLQQGAMNGDRRKNIVPVRLFHCIQSLQMDIFQEISMVSAGHMAERTKNATTHG